MRILMFGMSSYPGGIENFIVNYFANHQMSSQHLIDFITYEEKIAYESKLIKEGYKIHKVPHLKKNPMGYFKEVKKIFAENAYDCVYINMLTAANIIPIVLADVFKIKHIILHAHANETIQGFGRRLLHKVNKKYYNKKATLRLACSDAAGKWLFDENSYYIVPNAIDCDRFCYDLKARKKYREMYNIKDDQLVIGHIGRIAEEKNHLFMLKIMDKVLEKRENAKLIFVGDGYLADEVKLKAKKMGIERSVIFFGTSNCTNEIYPAFDIFLFPSAFEGFGMAALEAQACGIKVICSATLSQELNVSGTVEYIDLNMPPQFWADRIVNGKKVDPLELNDRVRNSRYNIEKQIETLLELMSK